MTTLTIELSEETLSRLQSIANDSQLSVSQILHQMIADYLDEDTPDEEIFDDIRQSLKEALAGDVRPLEDVLDELRRELSIHADND